jgi:putative heme-binding domain-containing protein
MRTSIFAFLGTAAALLAQQGVPQQAGASAGDPQAGKAIFEGKGRCATCHRVNGSGSRIGPDLSDAGTRSAASIERSLVDPDEEVRRESRQVRVVLKKDGKAITGNYLNSDAFTIQLREDDKLLSLMKSDLIEITVLTKDLMPSYKDTLSRSELTNVVAYLVTLKGFKSAPAPPQPANDGIH